eukprot:CAMPEP_0115128604 /NCGR_PEP_ID=MMETSP0227-20121206/51244_1 /TAXON_ID=89957 /ORGANISM="Polarella glacialis, Strain CCMP 1383" /LENGTH=405 /DNA_ID=CAMNT_0002533213 /DNA_START=95 /DNA_END=1308 /DNA_ORIENTATION=+
MLGAFAARAATAAARRAPSVLLSRPPLHLRFPSANTSRSAWRTKSATSVPFPVGGLGSSGVASEAVAVQGELVTPGWEKIIGLWLAGTSGLLYSMIAIGGYTRLSGSGLSMTDWRIQGRRLPFTQKAWEDEFEDYKRFPEYQRLHAGKMELDEFKRIYFVEWFHRMWGRSVGVLFAVPLAYFAARGGASENVCTADDRTFWAWPLAGLRWLVDGQEWLRIYSGITWHAFSLLRPTPSALHVGSEAIAAAKKLRKLALPVTACIALTLLSGPFVAGNDAGHAYNTWPKMLDDWIPPEWLAAVSNPATKWRAFFEDTAVVQFDHRTLAYASVAGSLGVWIYGAQMPLSAAAAGAIQLLPMAVAAQMCLGIATLMLYVPIELGVAHQAGGVAVLTTMLFVMHTLRTAP